MPTDGRRSIHLLDSATATGASSSHSVNATEISYQALGSTSSGAGSATITIEVSNVETPSGDPDWTVLATFTLTLDTTGVNDATSQLVPYRHVRANVTAISGTGADVDVYMQYGMREV